jgi:hypothetical protein
MKVWQRALALVLLVAAVAALVAIERHEPSSAPATFGTDAAPVQPIAPTGDALTTVWFCPGVPADADGSASGTISILNPTGQALTGTLTFTPTEGDPFERPLDVPGWGRLDVNPADLVHARFVAVQVEVFGTNAVVEQTTRSRAGTSLSPCAAGASPEWYLADGTTSANAQYTLLVWNPFPDDAIVDLRYASDEGTRTNDGLVVPAKSVRILDVDQTVRRSQHVSTEVHARAGRVVVGRYQTFRSLRRGLAAGVAAPAAGTSWLFPSGEKGKNISESVVIFNPSDDDAEVDVTLYPSDPSTGSAIEPISVSVSAKTSEVVDISGTDFVPDGRHSIQVTSSNDVPIVAERVFDRGAVQGNTGAPTTVELGSLLTGGRWFIPSSPPAGSGYALTIANATGSPSTAVVKAMGPAGPQAITGLQPISMPAAGSARVDLTGNGAAGQPLIVESDQPIVVDRVVVPPGEGTGATSSLAIVQG